MKYGSICSGIGGLDLAVEEVTGASPAWFCETDAGCRKILATHWPGVPIYGDIKTTDWSTVEPVDIISAGYPCQPFSQAGRKRGEEDPRHLWPTVFDTLRLLRPRYLICENVAAHLKRGFSQVLVDLASAGYDAEWAVIRASDVGAAHKRARLFFVAADASSGRRWQNAGGTYQSEELGRLRENPDHISESDGQTGIRNRYDDSQAIAYTDSGRLQIRGPGYGLAREAPLPRGRRPRTVDEPGSVERIERLRSVDWAEYYPAIQRWEQVFGRPAPGPIDEKGRLSIAFTEWIMGFELGWVNGIARKTALRALGNAVVPQQGILALSMLVPRPGIEPGTVI